jgi:hypothetical protein
MWFTGSHVDLLLMHKEIYAIDISSLGNSVQFNAYRVLSPELFRYYININSLMDYAIIKYYQGGKCDVCDVTYL